MSVEKGKLALIFRWMLCMAVSVRIQSSLPCKYWGVGLEPSRTVLNLACF